MEDLLLALTNTESSIRPWLETAENYAEYANSAGQYDDIKILLKKTKKKRKLGFL